MTQQESFDRYKYSIRIDKIGGGAFYLGSRKIITI